MIKVEFGILYNRSHVNGHLAKAGCLLIIHRSIGHLSIIHMSISHLSIIHMSIGHLSIICMSIGHLSFIHMSIGHLSVVKPGETPFSRESSNIYGRDSMRDSSRAF